MVALKNPLGILCHFLILKTTIIAWMSCCTFFCDSAFNVVKAFIRGTPPSLLCDNLKCELGGPAGNGGKCTPPENVAKIRKTRFLPFYKYYCYETRKRKKLLLTRKDVALVFSPLSKGCQLIAPGNLCQCHITLKFNTHLCAITHTTRSS